MNWIFIANIEDGVLSFLLIVTLLAAGVVLVTCLIFLGKKLLDLESDMSGIERRLKGFNIKRTLDRLAVVEDYLALSQKSTVSKSPLIKESQDLISESRLKACLDKNLKTLMIDLMMLNMRRKFLK